MLSESTYCEQLVRDGDKDLFLATLFAPADRRNALYALYAFNLELARIGDSLHEPMAGEIRLQWWREAIEGQRREEVAGHPIAAALESAMQHCALPRNLFEKLIDARHHNVCGDPAVSLEDFESRVQDSSATLVELAARILMPQGHASDYAFATPVGLTIGMIRLLRAFGLHASRGDLYLPGELLARHDVEPHDVLAGKSSAGLFAALAEIRMRISSHYEAARKVIERAPDVVASAWLPMALVPAYLQALDRHRDEPFAIVDVPQWRRQWTLWRAARVGTPRSL